MQVEIIPSITGAKNFEEFEEKIGKIKQYTTWVHWDISDGEFAPNFSWGDPVQIHNYDPGVFIELHLMVEAPELVMDDWLGIKKEAPTFAKDEVGVPTVSVGKKDSGVYRIYFHYEATENHRELIKKIKDAGKEVGVALLLETPIELIMPFQNQLDAVLIFSGNLGFYGGEFNEVVLEKISQLRSINSDVIIEIDGGMNPETAKKAVRAGANAIVSGGYIWSHKEGTAKAIGELRKSIM